MHDSIARREDMITSKHDAELYGVNDEKKINRKVLQVSKTNKTSPAESSSYRDK